MSVKIGLLSTKKDCVLLAKFSYTKIEILAALKVSGGLDLWEHFTGSEGEDLPKMPSSYARSMHIVHHQQISFAFGEL